MKRSWKDTIKKYSLESKNFDNYDGGGSLPISDGFIGQKRSASFIGENRNSSSYANGQSMGGDVYSQIADSDKYYTITVTNTNTTGDAQTAVIFGANEFGISNDQDSGTITVDVAESSHTEARGDSIMRPFWVNGLRYSTETTTQLNGQVLTIQYKSSSGDLIQKIFRPLVFKTASQNQSLQVDAPGYKFPVDGNTSIRVPVIASESVTLILQIGGRYDSTKAVEGESALSTASQRELATGIVTVVK